MALRRGPDEAYYTNIYGKSEWGEGEWQNEPDKITWKDPETEYMCIILRNDVTGTLCGYVGIPEGHPCYGLSMDGYTLADHYAYYQAILEEDSDEKPPEVVKPGGDAIKAIDVHGGLTFSGEGTTPSPDKVWWLGFDCSHAFDLMPALPEFDQVEGECTYRNIAYVKGECTQLAKQLKEVQLCAQLSLPPSA